MTGNIIDGNQAAATIRDAEQLYYSYSDAERITAFAYHDRVATLVGGIFKLADQPGRETERADFYLKLKGLKEEIAATLQEKGVENAQERASVILTERTAQALHPNWVWAESRLGAHLTEMTGHKLPEEPLVRLACADIIGQVHNL